MAPPLSRVMVFARVLNKGFNEEVYAGFDKGMRAGFDNCGIASETLHVNDMDLDPEKRFKDAAERFKPDAILIIRQAGGSVVIGQYGTHSDLILDMQFLDKKAKPFWHARSEFTLLTRNLYADDKASGEKFASDTVERLRTDGLLVRCKPPPAAPEKSADEM